MPAKQIEWRELKPDELWRKDPGPDIMLPMESAQKLMDQLWDCGLRPTEGSGSAGSFSAQGRHLDDMRRIVFKDHPGGES